MQEPWLVHFDANAKVFYFEDANSGQRVDVQPIPVPDGWACRFDDGHKDWYLVHSATSDWFWDLDVGVLSVGGFIPTGVDLTAKEFVRHYKRFACLLYTSPSPRDGLLSRMPSSA